MSIIPYTGKAREFLPEPLDPSALLADLSEMIRPLAERHNIRLETVVEPLPEPPQGDAAALRRALLNLLDIMLPGLDGFAICRELRRRGQAVPILMLTARGTVDDRVRGLDHGADDYLVKPFSGPELLARIRALLRRAAPDLQAPTTLRLGDIELDFQQLTCRRGAHEIPLTAREFRILAVLAAARGRPVSRDEILDKAWDHDAYPTTRTVDNQIVTLRQKLEPAPANPRYLLTVHGVGYRLRFDGGGGCNPDREC